MNAAGYITLFRAAAIGVQILARAVVLLAFSEFFFFNEGPVRQFLEAPDVIGQALHILKLVLFYCLPGSLLLALEPSMTTWPRTILAGAFVGWSIEAAMVPVAYENAPFSYFWTSVSWHALVGVCLGWFVLRRIFQSGSILSRTLSAIVMGGLAAVWSTWAWEDLTINAGQFSEIIAVALGLLIAGYLLSDRPALQVELGRAGSLIVIGVNLACWALWAAVFLPISLGLLALAVFNGLLLSGASVGEQYQTTDNLVPKDYLPLLFVLPSAWAAFWIIELTGQSRPIGEVAVLLVAFGGILIYTIAAFRALADRIQR